jgi:hypothetical protein
MDMMAELLPKRTSELAVGGLGAVDILINCMGPVARFRAAFVGARLLATVAAGLRRRSAAVPSCLRSCAGAAG